MNVFIDCGYHLGEGLKDFTSLLNIDDTWEVYCFEANPECNLEPNGKETIFNKAVWIHNDGVLFNQENNKNSNSPIIGSKSNLDGWGSYINDISSSHKYDSQVMVDSIDLSEWIKRFDGKNIYIKMDIEGAEFQVLRKMIKDNSISMVSEIWIEWHQNDLQDESDSTKSELENELKKWTKVNDWK